MERMRTSLVCVLAATALLFVVGVSPARAHDEFRFVGTLVNVEAAKNRVSVKFKENGKDETVHVKLTGQTLITRDKKKISKSDLKAGLSVVVDALGDDYETLEALEIRIVPAPAK